MNLKIISGGQTGADLGGLRAAKKFGLETGGHAPKGWLTEIGPAPWLAEAFGLTECLNPQYDRPPRMPLWEWEAACYRERTKANAAEADLTLWFSHGGAETPGYRATYKHACSFLWIIRYDPRRTTSTPRGLIDAYGYLLTGVVNIAGNRESKAPGIGAWVEAYLCEVFRAMGFQEVAR
jgi:hypothetical protein